MASGRSSRMSCGHWHLRKGFVLRGSRGDRVDSAETNQAAAGLVLLNQCPGAAFDHFIDLIESDQVDRVLQAGKAAGQSIGMMRIGREQIISPGLQPGTAERLGMGTFTSRNAVQVPLQPDAARRQ